MSAFSGYVLVDHYTDESSTCELRSMIEDYVAGHELPTIRRQHGGRGLCYRVIDGLRVERDLPGLLTVYEAVNAEVNERLGVHVVPVAEPLARVNVNITPPGGSYRWHYDRNTLTATLYLNEVAGGDLELCPNYRLSRGARAGVVGRSADRLLETRGVMRVLGRKVTVHPQPGLLVVMRGDRCLHSVTAVDGTECRVNLVMAFDHVGCAGRKASALDTYLYSQEQVSADPNYVRG
jgi:hypothetical protein